MSNDFIGRQAAIDAVHEDLDGCRNWNASGTETANEVEMVLDCLPSAQSDGWLEQNKDKILQAGMEGREIDFCIGERLFAIREKAQ